MNKDSFLKSNLDFEAQFKNIVIYEKVILGS